MPMKIAIISDIHGNLIALESLLKYFKENNIETIVHTGDAIGIGPFPSETLELFTSIKNCEMILGNHENYQITFLPENIGEEELKHQNWVKNQLNDGQKNKIKTFPKIIRKEFNGTKFSFIHSIYDEGIQDFTAVPIQDEKLLEKYFGGIDSDIIFYGHTHIKHCHKGTKEYINPGSAGCNRENIIHFILLTINDSSYKIENKTIEYNKKILLDEFENRKVPAREEIINIFY
jgi:putative phosphoesterase